MEKLNLKNHRSFLLFTSLVLLKFIFVRALLFEDFSIIYTAFLEIGYILLIFGVIDLIPKKKIKNALFVSVNFIFSILLVAVLVYHDYFGHIVTIHALSLLGQVGAVKDSVLQLINPLYFVLFIDFIFLAIYAFFKKKKPLHEEKNNLWFVAAMLVLGLAFVSYQIMSQKDNHIANTVIAAEKQGILTYEILAAKSNTLANTKDTLDEEQMRELPAEIAKLKEITPLPIEQRQFHGIAKNKNIIVIQAEAFQNFAINLEIDGQEVTPFLNELLADSLYFPNTFQQVGPGNTSDAEFIFNTSLYPGAWEATSELFGDREIPSFPKLLKEQAYTSLTYHANDIKFWNRHHLYPALGFDRYYDDLFFKNEDVIGIGSSDELVYEKAFPDLKNFYDEGQLFYAQFVTLTSHHPFKIPADRDTLPLPSKFDGTLVKDYLKSLTYTDLALKQFVDDLKDANMWEDTMLIFYGDHMGMHANGLTEEELDLLAELVGHDYTFLDQFQIPFIISLPGEDVSGTYETIAGQLDYMPTVANLLGLPLDDFVHFGQDVINYPDNLFGMRYYMPYGSFFNKEIAFKPAEGFDDGEAFDLKTAEELEDFSMYRKDYDRIMSLLKLSDDYMNSLPKR